MKEELRDFTKAFLIPFKEDNPVKLKQTLPSLLFLLVFLPVPPYPATSLGISKQPLKQWHSLNPLLRPQLNHSLLMTTAIIFEDWKNTTK